MGFTLCYKIFGSLNFLINNTDILKFTVFEWKNNKYIDINDFFNFGDYFELVEEILMFIFRDHDLLLPLTHVHEHEINW